MALGEIQTSLNGGELSPKLYARTDLAKFEAGAALLRNFIVDFRGGVVNRPGTKFIAACKDVAGTKRLIPFIVSTDAAYVLEFGDLYIRAFLQGVLVDEIVTPYLAADLALLKYTQSADVLTLVHPTYPPANLSRTSSTVFSYDLIAVGPGIDPPVLPAIASAMVAPHSGPYSFGYLITAVDLDGKEESLGSNPGVKHSEGMNETTNRVIGLTWTPPTQAVSRYNIYKWGPIDAVTMNPATVWGFIGTAQTNTFTDNNIAPDFSKQPPGWGDPFSGGQIESIICTAGGAGYDGVSGDWPTAIPYVPLVIVGDGTGASGYAVIDHATGKIIGAYLTNPGKNYTTATVTANGQGGTGATFSVSFSDIAPLYPACTAYVQQRRVFAGSDPKPETLVLSQIGRYNNFNTTPVSLATDAIPFSIAGEQVNSIKSMVGVSYGLLLFTTSEVHLLNGGSPYASITTESVSVQSQSSVGANDLQPLRVNADVLYTQNKGNRVRNLAFAWQKQAFQGSDISALAAHLFDGFLTTEWTWAEEPFKIAWLVRDDGRLVSLTYAPDQEVAAWCRHDTQGLFKSVCSVPEGDTNAVYFIVNRYIPELNPDPTDPSGNWFEYVERMAERAGCCIFDAWHLDCALALDNPLPPYTLFLSGVTGTVNITTSTTTGPLTPDFANAANYPSGGAGTINGAYVGVDWTGNRLYVFNPATHTGMSFNITSYAQVVAPTATAASISGATFGEDGNIYCPGGLSNQTTLSKINPGTMATMSTFGSLAGGFHTDSLHWALPHDFDVCFTAAGRPMMVSVAESPGPSNNECTVLDLPSMTWAGTNFSLTINTLYAGVTKGKAGEAWVFGYDNPTTGTSGAVLGLYHITVQSGPTIVKVSTRPASDIGHGWTHVTNNYGVFYDQTDGNLIAHVITQALTAWNSAATYFVGDLRSVSGHDYISLQSGNINHNPTTSPTFWRDLGVSGPAAEYRIIKINGDTGAIMWTVLVGNGFPGLGRISDTVVTNGLYCFQEASAPHTIHQINTLTGIDTVFGVNSLIGDYQTFNDALGIMLIFSSMGVSPPPTIISGATTWGSQWATYGPAPPPPQIGPIAAVGEVIQVGCGKVVISSVTNSYTATGEVISELDIDIPDDPNNTPIPIEAGDWSLTIPVSVVSGLDHLEGKEVWSLSDGKVVGPLTVVAGSVNVGTAATNIVVGLKYTQQIQTLYLTMDDLQRGSIQGKRKLVPAATLRLDCTKGIEVGQDFDNLTPVPDCGDIDANFVGLSPGDLFEGDAYVVLGAAWDEKGEICIQQDLPLPASVLGIIVQVAPGDTGS